jgi:hypothetical protein
MHRPTLGLIAVTLLAIGLATLGREDQALASACLRVGAVMAILWFAQPQLKDIPRWVIAAGGAVLIVALRWPRLLVVALPLAALLYALRPRQSGTPRRE